MESMLDNCEKEIREHLDKLESFQSSLQMALQAIQNVREQSQDLPFVGSADELLHRILNGTLNRSGTAPDLIADSTQVSIPNDEASKISIPNVIEVAAEADEKPEEHVDNEEIKDDGSSDEFVEHMLRVAGAKKGVKYKIEVTSPLAVDGTFWACHVESGFIQNKLEPLSDRLRSATQHDRSLWQVDDLSKQLCLKSIDNGLWMRAILLKKINDQLVKVRLVDVGKTEDCPLNRLSNVPEHLAKIPFMAFNCALFDHTVTLGYDAKWQFSDLTKKKVLNFTVENVMDRDGLSYLMGKIETILDEPIVNVTEELKKFDKVGNTNDGNQEANRIVSRDIRTINAVKSDGFTAVTEVIRSTKEDAVSKNVSFEESTKPVEIPTKQPPNILPLIIPSSPPQPQFDWGDTKTPGENDCEFELPPLDENIFDMSMPCDERTAEVETSSTSNYDKPISNTLQYHSSNVTNSCKNDLHFSPHTQQPQQLTNETAITKLQKQLLILLQQQQNLLQSPHISQENPDALNQKIEYVQTNLNSLLTQQPIYPIRQQIPHESQQNTNFTIPASSIRSPQMPIGTRPTLSPIGQRMPAPPHYGSHFNEDIQSSRDYNTKIQQLDAITRCLRMPSDCLDDTQMQELQLAKRFLEKQLQEEENRMKQMGRTLLMQGGAQQPPGLIEESNRDSSYHSEVINMQQQMRNFSPTEHRNMADYFNPRFGEPLAGMNPEQMQHLFHAQNNTMPHQLDMFNKQTPKAMPELLPRQTIQEFAKQVEQEELPVIDFDNMKKSSETVDHLKALEPQRFETVPYDTLFTESRNDWAARELVNLTHPYLEHPKARFYTVICLETKPGNFIPNLKRTYVNGYYWLHDPDATVFRQEWDNNDGPLFLIVKHRPLKGNVMWKCGGICQVLSKVREIPNVTVRQNNMNMQCQVKFVSTALFEDIDCLRSDKSTREIPREVARKVIKHFIQSVQDGSGENMFHYFQKSAQTPYHKPGSTEMTSYHSSGRNTPPDYHMTAMLDASTNLKTQSQEDWDQDLQHRRRSSGAYGSGDECERDINAEIEAFGLSADDLG